MTWRKPKRCEANNCIEVEVFPNGTRLLRSTKRPWIILTAEPDEWPIFRDAVKNNEFD